MMLFRLIGNLARILAFLVQSILYWPGRILGTKLALFGLMIAGVGVGTASHEAAWVFVAFVAWAIFRLFLIIVPPPHPLVLFRAPPPPPPPPPSAVVMAGRADDPNEATMVGRLDPKLRSILKKEPS